MPDVGLADELESRLYQRAAQEWIKYRDTPLGEVIADKSRRRKILREHGGRDGLRAHAG